MKNKTIIVIPYCSEGAQGRELEYAVAGWRRHFKEDYLIVLAGEDHPVTKTGNDIVCVPSPRVAEQPGQYRQHLDYVSCLRKVRERFPDSEGFIMVADDCYAVNDFDMADVLFFKMLEPEFNCNPDTTNKWRQDKLKTKRALREAGLPTRNYTTHIPMWFDWEKWLRIVEEYDMDHESYLIEDLYFNTYYQGRIPFRLDRDRDNLKYGVYTSRPPAGELQAAFRKKIWITNSPDGWRPELESMLKQHYDL